MSRTVEFTLAAIFLVLSAPIIVAAAVVTACLSRRAPFVAHLRVGYRGRFFRMLKLRTMWDPNAPRPPFTLTESLAVEPPPVDKNIHDPRIVSRFAAFCRRASIDEFPQFWHVLTGDLALVGPRPITAEEHTLYYGAASREVLSVKPGITGLWQVRGRNSLTYRQRRRLDLFFVRHQSPGFSALILWWTLRAVFAGENAR
jgi:lipopolysaccharide/colanic/teichoic acid biosynthesis glycosyltransferase